MKECRKNDYRLKNEPPFYFCYGKHISIGDGSYINVNCNFIDERDKEFYFKDRKIDADDLERTFNQIHE